MSDIERFTRPLRENFNQINTDKDGFLGKKELNNCHENPALAAEVRDMCGLASKNLQGIESLTDKHWWQRGITQKDLAELEDLDARAKDAKALAQLGLTNFKVLDTDHDGILEEDELSGTPLSGTAENIGHVVSTSTRYVPTMMPVGKGLAVIPIARFTNNYGISEKELENYPENFMATYYPVLKEIKDHLPDSK